MNAFTSPSTREVLSDLLQARGLDAPQVATAVRIAADSTDMVDVVCGSLAPRALEDERAVRRRKRRSGHPNQQLLPCAFLVLPATDATASAATLSVKRLIELEQCALATCRAELATDPARVYLSLVDAGHISGSRRLAQRRLSACRPVTTLSLGGPRADDASPPSARPRLPLEGIRVVECGHLIAGPFAGTILSYFGADVIKVEPPTGDQVRQYRSLDSTGTSLWWYSLGRNKRSVAIDMRQADGRDLVRELVSQSDVFIENFRPGRMEKWGLGPDSFESANPDLVYARISGFGQDGPYSSRAGFASVCEAMGGFRYVNGFPDRQPARPNLSVGDTVAGIHAALGIVVALLGRERGVPTTAQGGGGQVVDVAIYEAMYNLMEAVVPEFDYSGEVRERSGSTITGIVPSNTYTSQDGKDVVLAANIDSLFVRLMVAIGREDMAHDPKFRTNADRVVHQAEIDDALAAWTATQPVDAVVAAMEAAQVPVGLVYSVEDMVRDPQFKARGMFEEVAIPDGASGERPLKIPAILPKLQATPGRTAFAGRRIGQDTRQVLRDELGRSASEIARLFEQQIVFEQ